MGTQARLSASSARETSREQDELPLGTVGSGRRLACGASKRANAGTKFPDSGDQDHQRLARGRRRRPVGADYRRPAPEAVGPSGHGGKPDRRKQQHRGRGGRGRGNRWVYPARPPPPQPPPPSSPFQTAQHPSRRRRGGGGQG